MFPKQKMPSHLKNNYATRKSILFSFTYNLPERGGTRINNYITQYKWQLLTAHQMKQKDDKTEFLIL